VSAEPDEGRDLLAELVAQIELGNLRDDHGHDFKMNAAFVKAKTAVAGTSGPSRQQRADELIRTAVIYEPGDDLVESGWYDRARAYLKEAIGWP
jgi:hypothetical protein